MAGAGKKWMVGCGIGCGLMLLILGGAGTCAFFGVQKFKDKAEGIDAGFEAIQTRYGEPTDFVPAADGTISALRMEAFLAIREDMAPTRREMSDMLRTLDEDGNWIAKAQAGLKLVPALLSFISERNAILVQHDMGVGEYQHIYSLSYFVLLGKDPGDGPGFMLSGDDEDNNGGHVRFGHSGGSGDVREKRAREVRETVNQTQSAVLGNQLTAYRATLAAGADPADDTWGAALLAEHRAMQDQSLRLPWEDGLPAPLAASLEPYRDRLDSSYDEMTSTLEIGLTNND